ncbi:MAG: hypothetical protein HN846_01440 [Candidatus Pacebacteria bacterium]|nr:hypothetical protein [Candidatus Paceibacterota bacterium]MBT3511852.1 hypothetical protein [Candidatus Paceibacterota bacterium]MBT4004433.1 hypothetical protein [Candidatus Paceibacterota bacterium]MBT4358545.1 hypothetical protein [Candidatus Paceibacterota bacterium]MBT4680717.1 hypothetical protein [Candidatus Paceibacterota bacterium]
MKKIYLSIIADEKKYLFFLFLVAFLVRLFLIQNNSFVFRWDQARDAILSRSIIENHDLKIQGPSASGTQDQVYHGVLYYYLIAPLYTFSGGDPRFVIFVLTLIFSTSVVPVYFLTKSFSNSKLTGFFTALLFAVSVDTASIGTWLSNPIMALLFIPFFYWRVWEIFFLENKKHLWLLALGLGLSHQAAISSLYLFIPLGFSYLYLAFQKRNLIVFTLKEYLLLISIYLVSISTIILSHYKIYQAGIFKISTFTGVITESSSKLENLPNILELYLKKIQFNLIPQSSLISLIIFLPILIYFIKKINFKQRIFYSIYFLSAFIFLFLHYRNSIHSLISLSVVILIPIGFLLKEIALNFKKTIFSIVLVFIFLATHILKSAEFKKQGYALYAVDQGYFFNEKLELMNKIFNISGGNQFSISTFTIPYGHNTTWAYLFGWYGEMTYDKKPLFYGPDQRGIFGEEYLEMAQNPELDHFTIYEPSVGSYESKLRVDFTYNQDKIGQVTEKFNFGTIEVEIRKSNQNS